MWGVHMGQGRNDIRLLFAKTPLNPFKTPLCHIFLVCISCFGFFYYLCGLNML